MREEKFGDLRVRLAGGSDRQGGGEGPILVLMHGFGAPGDDLVPLWRVLDVPENVRFAFPEAPLSLPAGYGGGRAWWMIDIERMQRAMAGEAFDRGEEVPEGMKEARLQVEGMLAEMEKRLGGGQLVLGGFSQGAMMGCAVAFESGQRVDGLVVMSGTLLSRGVWAKGAVARKGLRVVQSHGRRDQLLGFAAAQQLRELMVGAGLEVEWVEHGGGHEIPEKVLEKVGELVTKVVARE